jgi:hypothetical protein
MKTAGRYVLIGAAALLAVHACDTGTPTAGIDRGGVRTPVSVEGAITGFGSIVVNGVHYELASAQVRMDDAPATEADLRLGQVVTISGDREESTDRASASTVTFSSNVQGPLAAVDTAAGVLTVLGQTVVVNADTVFDLGARAPAIGSLSVGEALRVSGFVGASGSITAARVEQRPAAATLRVAGRVARLDRSAARFDINALSVSYAAAVVVDGFPTGQPSDGDEVVVTGSVLAPGGALLATTLVRQPTVVTRRVGDEFEVEGLITRFVSSRDFDVAGVRVTTTASTLYEHGNAGTLALDLKVHVSGRVNTALELEARKVEIDD